MIIRDETPADADAITAVTAAAFRDHPYSHQTEPFIVVAPRRGPRPVARGGDRRPGGRACRLLAGDIPEGRVTFHPAFQATE